MPIPAAAQLGAIDKLAEHVSGISLEAGWGVRSRSREATVPHLHAYSFEIMIDLEPADERGKGADYQLGIGYSMLTGFAAKEPTLDLHGSIRSLPTLTGYASRQYRGKGPWFYLGGEVGVAELWNARGYDDSSRVYTVAATTLEAGLTAGLYVAGVFVEAGFRNRDFALNWTLPDPIKKLPSNWPRSLQLNSWTITVGYQLGKPASK